MKILHVIEKIEKAAGTTTFCVRVAEELAALGHEVAILICRENPECDAVPRNGVRVIKYAVGAAEDLLNPGVNGYAFDPVDEGAITRAFKRIMGMTSCELAAARIKSLSLSSEVGISRFVEAVKSMQEFVGRHGN